MESWNRQTETSNTLPNHVGTTHSVQNIKESFLFSLHSTFMYQDNILSIKTQRQVKQITHFHWGMSSVEIWLYFGEVMHQNILRINSIDNYQSNVCDISTITKPDFKKTHTKCVQYDYSKYYCKFDKQKQNHKIFEAIIPKGQFCIYSRLYHNGVLSFNEWLDILHSITVHDMSSTDNAYNWNVPINNVFFWGACVESWNPYLVYFDINNNQSDLIDLSPVDKSYLETITYGIQILDQLIFLGYKFFIGDESPSLVIFLFSSEWNDLALETTKIMCESGLPILSVIDGIEIAQTLKC